MTHDSPARRRRFWFLLRWLLPAALVATPFLVRACRHYGPMARVAEARGRIAFLLTAARSYADEHESDNDPATADWPGACGVPYLLDDCGETPAFTYDLLGVRNGALTITATGKPAGRMAGVTVRLTVVDPRSDGQLRIAGL